MSGMSSQEAVLPGSSPRSDNAVDGVPIRGGKFLTFFLAGEEYGIEILKVHEIIGMMPITSVPRTPESFRGVINLRGKVIPIVDLRSKFGMEPKEPTAETCIIVVNVQGLVMGVVVDCVSEVLNIAAEEIEDAPSFGTDIHTNYILGIGKSQGRVKILLDIGKVMENQELASQSWEAGGNSGSELQSSAAG
jgi:purine-binding chemotaxis protein CheW